jgi:hypothetical protein
MEIANVLNVECELAMEHEGFRIRERQIGPQLGADLIGGSGTASPPSTGTASRSRPR